MLSSAHISPQLSMLSQMTGSPYFARIVFHISADAHDAAMNYGSAHITLTYWFNFLWILFWFAFCCFDKTLTKSKLREKWVYFSLCFQVISIIKETKILFIHDSSCKFVHFFFQSVGTLFKAASYPFYLCYIIYNVSFISDFIYLSLSFGKKLKAFKFIFPKICSIYIVLFLNSFVSALIIF